ncbi:hypothetical protein [Rhizobium sp. Leaf383]|uniref:hypothetical protein n=1 Tax=Rhizobium sp. Leaf383 TaxID=1736357 RepID=UPI0012E374D9|nr:hypothetical protein [Rhizobium sp. Leaf383]
MIDVICDYQFEHGEAKAQIIDSLLWVARDLADGIVASLDRSDAVEPSAVEVAIAAYHAAEAAWRPHELSDETPRTKALFAAKEAADNAVMIAPCRSLEDVRAKARLCFSDENVMDSLQKRTWANERVLTQFLCSILGEDAR